MALVAIIIILFVPVTFIGIDNFLVWSHSRNDALTGTWKRVHNIPTFDSGTIVFSKNHKITYTADNFIFNGTYYLINDNQIEVKWDDETYPVVGWYSLSRESGENWIGEQKLSILDIGFSGDFRKW